MRQPSIDSGAMPIDFNRPASVRDPNPQSTRIARPVAFDEDRVSAAAAAKRPEFHASSISVSIVQRAS